MPITIWGSSSQDWSCALVENILTLCCLFSAVYYILVLLNWATMVKKTSNEQHELKIEAS